MGSRSGGFWRTFDGGANWQNTTDFFVGLVIFTVGSEIILVRTLFYFFENLKEGVSFKPYKNGQLCHEERTEQRRSPSRSRYSSLMNDWRRTCEERGVLNSCHVERLLTKGQLFKGEAGDREGQSTGDYGLHMFLERIADDAVEVWPHAA